VKKIIEKLIARLKKDPSYEMDSNYSTNQLLHILYYRFFQLSRGFFVKLRISAAGFVFCDRGVVIQHGYQIKAGRNLILESNVHLNALSKNGIILGDHVTIAKYSVLVCTGVVANKGIGIRIGNNSAIGAYSFFGGQGGILIGNDVIMGPQVMIFSENHNYRAKEIIIRKQGESRKGVAIGDNCWIGAGVIILDGVSIGSGSVIGAGSVITKSISQNSIAIGSPAKVVAFR
jgi:acetyltransferase-like isoleucine patch superfamily enzyme